MQYIGHALYSCGLSLKCSTSILSRHCCHFRVWRTVSIPNREELGRVMFGHCAFLDGVKIQVGLKMKDTGSRSYPESDSVE